MEAESFGSADTLVHPSRSLLLRPPALLPRFGKKQAFGLLTGAKVEKLSSDTNATTTPWPSTKVDNFDFNES